MAKAKMQFKTPLLPLSWVQITGQGKLKKGKDTVTFPDKKTMEVEKKKFDAFWRENKPAGCTKQMYQMFKPETEPDLDKDGKEQFDEDDALIRKETGRYTLQAKTLTHWPKDGKQNKIKVLRANGDILPLGDKQIGNESVGIIHGSVGINDYADNEGLQFYLNTIQLKKFVEYEGSDSTDAEDLGDDEGMDGLDIDAAVSDVSDKPDV